MKKLIDSNQSSVHNRIICGRGKFLINERRCNLSYESALEAAGAKVLAFEHFGDYQGTWYAKVEYNGEVGWVEGSYGSCSGCDAFEGEFSYSYDGPDYQQRLADFGRTYLDGVYSQELQEQYLEKAIDEDIARGWEAWTQEKREILAFIKANA